MINLVFVPGSYGHYLASCIVLYSNLTKNDSKIPEFSLQGDSHASIPYIKRHIICTHEPMYNHKNNRFIFINPDYSSQLEYLDNQLEKFYLNNLDWCLKKMKLQGNACTVWEARELCSFWIEDLLNETQTNFIKKIDCRDHVVDVNDIFDNIKKVLKKIFNYLELKQNIDDDRVLSRHYEFLEKQKNRGIQKKIYNWVNNTISNQNKKSPCRTFFDEAYVQHLLRKKGYEIKCYNLDKFPNNSADLRSLLI